MCRHGMVHSATPSYDGDGNRTSAFALMALPYSKSTVAGYFGAREVGIGCASALCAMSGRKHPFPVDSGTFTNAQARPAALLSYTVVRTQNRRPLLQ